MATVYSRTIFKTASLVYKYLNTGFPKYFSPYLSLYKSTYNTRRNEDVGTFLVDPKFQSTIYKSTKQFGFSFAFDAPTIWNALPNEVRACPSIGSFRRS